MAEFIQNHCSKSNSLDKGDVEPEYSNDDNLTNHIKSSTDLEEHLSLLETDNGLFRYLLFCFTLANDFEGLKSQLLGVRDLKHESMWISLSEIRYYEQELTNGILGNAVYKNAFDSVSSKLALHRIEGTNNESTLHFNIFDLASVVGSDNCSTEMIKLLLESTESVHEPDIQSIICNPYVDTSIVRAIMHHIVTSENKTFEPSWVTRIIFDLDEQLGNIVRNDETDMLLSKLDAIMESTVDSELERCILLKLFLHAVALSNYTLMNVRLNRLKAINRSNFFASSHFMRNYFTTLCAEKRYFTVHLLIKTYKTYMEQIGSTAYPFIFSNRMSIHNIFFNNIFLANYFLQQNMIDFDELRYHCAGGIFNRDKFIFVWLLYCYDPNKRQYISECDLSRATNDLGYLSKALGILCDMGADIDATDGAGTVTRITNFSWQTLNFKRTNARRLTLKR